jgi:hypothetical protein
MNLFGTKEKDAEFSGCGEYRYWLKRSWDETKPKVMFIGLNPSKADKVDDDPTIRIVCGFARRWGFGGVYMLNLFAVISTDPKLLLTHKSPVGEFNDHFLSTISKECGKVVFAWGAFKQAQKREKQVIAMFPDAVCLVKMKGGQPGHPLMKRLDLQPIYYDTSEPWIYPSSAGIQQRLDAPPEQGAID